MQYPNGQIAHDSGKIININKDKIRHSSSGSPLIKRYNNNLIIGIHYGVERDINKKIISNLATPFDAIIKDMNDKLYKNKNECRNMNTFRVLKTTDCFYSAFYHKNDKS